MEPSKQEIRFTLTQSDFWHLLLHAFARRRGAEDAVWIFFILVVVAVTLLTKQPATLLLGLAFAVVVFGVVFLGMWLASIKSARSLRNRGTHVVSISQEGIVQHTEQTDSTTRWQAVKSISANAHAIYFQLDNPGRVYVALIVPKRAFGDASAAEAFLSEARGHFAAR